MARLLTINGVTFDRDRIRVYDESHRGMTSVAFLVDADGDLTATLRATHRPLAFLGSPPDREWLAVAKLWIAGRRGMTWLDAAGRACDRPDGADWAPLLDLAIEAGLVLPEPACR